MNLLTENADIISAGEAEMLLTGNVPYDKEYLSKGYISDVSDEEKLFRSRYLDFVDDRDNDEVQIFYVNNYSCNFNCSYVISQVTPRLPANTIPKSRQLF